MTLLIGILTAIMVMLAFIAIVVGPGKLRNIIIVPTYFILFLSVGLTLADYFQFL